VNEPVLITGAGGFAGSHLLDAVARPGRRVAAWFKPDAAPPAGTRPGVEWTGIDLVDGRAVDAAIADLRPATVFHCAGAAHVGSSWTDTLVPLESNVLATHHLLRAIARAAPRAQVLVPSSALVYRSTAGVLDEASPIGPGTPYGVSKLAQEMLAVRAALVDGLHVVVARPFNHIGPRQDPSFVTAGFAQQIAEIEAGLRPPEIRVGNLDARRDLTDVRDTVRAYRLMIDRALPGRPLNVCSGVPHRIGDLLEALLRLSGASVRVTVDPVRLRPSDLPLLVGSRKAIQAEVGWEPEIPIGQTLADTLDFWRAQVAGRATRP
jgi:GDP-4-dehydro-6-deoxy-D-mannose reductase